MIKTFWPLPLLCFALIACGNANLENDPGLTKSNLKTVTDLSSCRGPTPTGTSLFHSQWRQDLIHSESGIRYQQIFQFETGAISMSLTCSQSKSQVTVLVRSSASVVGTQIRILTQDSDERFLNVEGELISCKASLQSGTVLSFQFEGPCLKLSENGRIRTLVPTVAIPSALPFGQ